jgi:hypothetical protein
MGQPTFHSPVLLLLAAFSRHEAALNWARRKASNAWGPIALESPQFEFAETRYYDATMGAGLKKVFLAFERPWDPAGLIEIKLETNRWEEEFAATTTNRDVASAVTRPLNLDPGYLTLGKLVLASTKDFAHRVYLSRGIYAEVTLQFKHGRWEHHQYTFPDYRRVDYQQFFTDCRGWLKNRMMNAE